MDILACSDTHWPNVSLAGIEQAVLKHQPDIIVIAGDLLHEHDPERLREYVSWWARFDQTKLCVLGNHDIWHETLATRQLYENLVHFNWAAYGFHCLDKAPYTKDTICFAGNMGWYDYSFFSPTRELVYSCEEFAGWEGLAREDFQRLCVPANEKHLCDLTAEDLERKVVAMPGETLSSAHWYDRVYTRWDRNDREMCGEFVQRLRADIQAARTDVVAVLHHAPYSESLSSPRDVVEAYTSAYRGSRLLGEAIEGKNVRAVIHGHIHRNQVYRKGLKMCISCSSTPQLIQL